MIHNIQIEDGMYFEVDDVTDGMVTFNIEARNTLSMPVEYLTQMLRDTLAYQTTAINQLESEIISLTD